MTELRNLLETLRQGARPPLSVDDVELLLGWLTGSATRDGEPGDELPRPGHDPVLLQMVLHRLDDVLFDGGELKPSAAGLDSEEPATRRRIRFRRLASAFHPDRFPDLADWLTQRSQAVHRAYARFKQDPEAPAVVPPPAPAYPPGSSVRNVRPAAARVRKRRIRAFANRLRARFGNDRYLAPKLIGGLAVLALLPVLNMVLVPAPSSEDAAGSAVSSSGSVDAGEEEKPVSGFRVPVSGENQDGGAATSEPGFAGAVSGRDRSAQDAPATTTTGGPDSQSLAGQAPTTVAGSGTGEDPQTDPEPSTDVGAGLAGDDGSSETQSLAGQAPTSEAGSGTGENPQIGRDPSKGVGAGLAGDDGGSETQSLARQAPTPVDGSVPVVDSDSVSDSSTGVGAGPAGDERGPETGNPKPAPTAADPEISPLLAAARRAMNPNGEIATVAALQTVDEQLAAMGLENDTERLYRRIHGEEESPVGTASSRDQSAPEPPPTEPTTNNQQLAASQPANRQTTQPPTGVGAGPAGDGAQPDSDSLARQAPTPVAGPRASEESRTDPEPSTGVGAGLAGDDRDPESRVAANQTEITEPDAPARKPETGNRKPVPSAPEPPPTEPTTNNQQLASGQPAPSAQTDSELALGPLGRHPAGEVLQRFHAAMQAGNIAGIAGSFAQDARMDSLRGRDEIADHFRSALNPADSRQVNLKVLRLGREDDGWRVEADLDLRIERSGKRENLLAGRSNFLLTGRGDQLLISRMDIE